MGESANYYQIGFNGGPVSNVMDSTTAAADGMTIGNAFENGLFYSTMKPSALKDFPVDGTPEEKFNALYAVFGTPNGLYWKNSPTGTQYTSFDEFRDAEYNKETGAKILLPRLELQRTALLWHPAATSLTVPM